MKLEIPMKKGKVKREQQIQSEFYVRFFWAEKRKVYGKFATLLIMMQKVRGFSITNNGSVDR